MQATVTSTIKNVQHKFSCEVNGIVMTNSSYRKKLVYLELSGPVTSRAAIVARFRWTTKQLNKRDSRVNTNVSIDGSVIYFEHGQKFSYKSIKDRTIVISSLLDDREIFVSTNDNPTLYFMDALRKQLTTIPTTAEMTQFLWENGQNSGLIVPMVAKGFDNITFWRLKTNNSAIEQWEKIIKLGAIGGELWRDQQRN